MADENDRTATRADDTGRRRENAADVRENADDASLDDPREPGAMPDEEAGVDDAGAGDADGDLAARLQEAERKLEGFRDQALRAQAEAENTRRRATRDVENAHKYALEKFTADLLPVLDSLDKAVEVASESESEGAKPIAEGVELSLKLFLSVLEKHGMERSGG